MSETKPGRLYRRRWDGALEETTAATDGEVEVWICRRVADFMRVPTGAAVAHCGRCGEEIAYNPRRLRTVPGDTPKVCIQCAGIEPLPIEGPPS